MKTSKLFAVFGILIVLVSNLAFAATTLFPRALTPVVVTSTGDFSIDLVKVDGVSISSGTAVFVERGSTVPVEVYVRGTNKNAYDTRVRVYLGGYEYGDVEALSSIFEVENNVVYPKTLMLKIPYDLDASDFYTLNVEVFDDDHSTKKTYQLRVQEVRHSVNIYDVIFNPTNNVEAGQYLFATVRLENLGDNLEDTTKVSLSVPALNLITSQFVGELITQQDVNEGGDLISSRRVSATTNQLALLVPENAPEGDYQVVVKAEFDRGYGVQQKAYTMHVKSTTPVVDTNKGLTINVDSSAQKIVAGQGAQFKFSVSNLGQDARNFNLVVEGTADWASYRVDPQTLNVEKNGVGEFNLFVAPLEGVDGVKSLIVKVKSNNNVLAEKTLTVETVKSSNGAETAKKVLAWIFVVLLVILVILAIAVIVRKLTENKEDTPVEGQTYY